MEYGMSKLFVSNVLGFDISLLERYATYYNRFNPTFLFTINLNRDSETFQEAESIISNCCNDYIIYEWDDLFKEELKMKYQQEAISKNCSDNDIIIYADSDEFQHYPNNLLNDFITGKLNIDHIRGKFVDRISSNGELINYSPDKLLEVQYPLGGDITYSLLNGCPNKIVCAKANVILEWGHHYVKGRPRWYEMGAQKIPCINVHHFKWNGKTLERFKKQIDNNIGYDSPNWRKEQQDFIKYIDSHGKILLDNFKPVREVLNI
jgi:hypothetical protein